MNAKRERIQTHIPFTKINSKQRIFLNVKHKAIKLLEGHTRENKDGVGCGDALLDAMPKTGTMEEMTGKLDFTKMLNVCSVKDITRELGDKPQIQWESL